MIRVTIKEPNYAHIILIGVGITGFSIAGLAIILSIKNKKSVKKKKLTIA